MDNIFARIGVGGGVGGILSALTYLLLTSGAGVLIKIMLFAGLASMFMWLIWAVCSPSSPTRKPSGGGARAA